MKELFSYLDALAANNNREWFAAHKAEYERLRARWIDDVQRLIDLMSAYDPSLAHVQAR